VIAIGDDVGWCPGTITGEIDPALKNRTPDSAVDVRSCYTASIPPTKENEWLYSTIFHHAMDVNQNTFQFGIFDVEIMQILKYSGSTADHYVWHSDECVTVPGMTQQRKLSASIALNDGTEYEGGELEISLDQSNQVTDSGRQLKEIGNAVFFPSFMRHRVTPVTKGTRYSIVAWFAGPRWI
jgi:PKHD-type hydroxylase